MTDPALDSFSQSRPSIWQLSVVVGVLSAFGFFLLFEIWVMGRPIALPNAEHEKLECASYTPSHNGRMLDAGERRAWIESDLKLLAKHFRCVRTYSVSEELDEVPRLARGLGLKVLLGLWISMDAPSNDREIARGIDLANEYTDVVTGVIVGNEVLLRRELTTPQLRAHIERVRAATKVPVTYADVWEFWLRNADLATAADFVTIHILPYWEDDPIDIDRALDHVQSIYRKVQGAFPGKVVLIGETGWPSAGRPRLNAMPGVINEARFIREFVVFAERENVPYNLIEAFDQPWKRNQEGTVGGYWGLFTAHGDRKFEFFGPVVADSNWRLYVFISIAGAVLFGAFSLRLRPRPSLFACVLATIAGLASGSLFVLQFLYISKSANTTLDWLASLSWSVVGWAGLAVIIFAIARWTDGGRPSTPIGIAELLRGLGHGDEKPDTSARVLGLARLLILAGMAYVSLGLAYDGRGRDFPIAIYVFPILGFGLIEFISRPTKKNSMDREESILAFILVATSMFIAYNETYLNSRALLWCGLCVVFGVTIGIGQWRSLNPNQSAQ